MKNVLLTFIGLAVWTVGFAQKTELKMSLNSGLFSFSGQSATQTSAINTSNSANSGVSGYTNNPYGTQAGLGYGLSATLTRVTRKEFFVGLDVGYEILRSKVLIDHINGSNTTSSFQLGATGETYLNFTFLNLYPHIGQRLIIDNIAFDISAGLDVAYCISANEKGNATASDGTKFTTSRNRKTIDKDARPRIQLAATYNKWGVYIGYSRGLANYLSGYVGGTNDCSSRLIRFGVTYQVI